MRLTRLVAQALALSHKDLRPCVSLRVCLLQIQVNQQERKLTISGERGEPQVAGPGSEANDSRKQLERSFGKFSRSLTLPKDADLEGISARCACVCLLDSPKTVVIECSSCCSSFSLRPADTAALLCRVDKGVLSLKVFKTIADSKSVQDIEIE